jgi:hypothetical protein
LVDSSPNQLTPAISTGWPALLTIWLPAVLSGPESAPPLLEAPSTAVVLSMLSVGGAAGMVPVPIPCAIVAPLGLESTTLNDSAAAIVSPVPATWMVCWVWPGANVRVPD